MMFSAWEYPTGVERHIYKAALLLRVSALSDLREGGKREKAHQTASRMTNPIKWKERGNKNPFLSQLITQPPLTGCRQMCGDLTGHGPNFQAAVFPFLSCHQLAGSCFDAK